MTRKHDSKTLEKLYREGRADGAYLDFCGWIEDTLIKRALTLDERDAIKTKCEYWFLVRIESDRHEAAVDYLTGLAGSDGDDSA